MEFDGSAVEGYARVQEADMVAKPDPGTFQVLPGRGDGGWPGCSATSSPPRASPSTATRAGCCGATWTMAARGFTVYVAPELEFFLFDDAESGRPLDIGRTSTRPPSTCPRTSAASPSPCWSGWASR